MDLSGEEVDAQLPSVLGLLRKLAQLVGTRISALTRGGTTSAVYVAGTAVPGVIKHLQQQQQRLRQRLGWSPLQDDGAEIRRQTSSPHAEVLIYYLAAMALVVMAILRARRQYLSAAKPLQLSARPDFHASIIQDNASEVTSVLPNPLIAEQQPASSRAAQEGSQEGSSSAPPTEQHHARSEAVEQQQQNERAQTQSSPQGREQPQVQRATDGEDAARTSTLWRLWLLCREQRSIIEARWSAQAGWWSTWEMDGMSRMPAACRRRAEYQWQDRVPRCPASCLVGW